MGSVQEEVGRRSELESKLKSEMEKKENGRSAGSEFRLYTERCIVQKLLAEELPWASIGFHDLRCPSNSQSTPFWRPAGPFRRIQWSLRTAGSYMKARDGPSTTSIRLFVPLISPIVDAGMENFGGARDDVIDGGMTCPSPL